MAEKRRFKQTYKQTYITGKITVNKELLPNFPALYDKHEVIEAWILSEADGTLDEDQVRVVELRVFFKKKKKTG